MASQGQGSGGQDGQAQAARRLERNLAVLGGRSAKAINQIRAAAPRADLSWTDAPDGGTSGSVGTPPRQLASLRAPLAEADRFAAGIDIAGAACLIVRGFGLGHHVGALARRLKEHGAIIVFEPDLGLLRAVLETIDCTPWLSLSNIALVTDAEDTGAIAAATSGLEAVLSAGTTIIDHPPSKARLSGAADRFAENFTTVMKAVRTNVVTTLVQVDITLTNLLMNVSWYATAPGVADLAGACKGKPAVVVSAGPSLRRNIDLLSRPGVRDRVVIIAVQTVLKTLLARGIRPHFVTALDYHEISRRFYEGLTAADVEGVTLVVEPKCNRAILEAYPGRVRCVGDHVLEKVLGPELSRPMGDITPGATVAHLAYYLARHLGCDPVILIGQDLGFTDGQYYAPGAAIHQVWSGELSEFRTLEMMEWERIARMRSLLRKVKDQQGRDIYTDEQMSTYLVQFERDFMQDAAKGLTTIDATEGGVLKKHTTVMPLGEALAKQADATAREALFIPEPAQALGEARLRAVEKRLADLRRSTTTIATLAREGEAVLTEMLDHQRDIDRVNRLIAKVDACGKKAAAECAYWLVQYINQTGQFNRYRASRAIHIDPALGPMEKQRKEIERDIVNVRWLADAAQRVGELLEESTAALHTGASSAARAKPAEERPPALVVNDAAPSVWAVVHVDSSTCGLGTPRDLSRPFLLGLNPLQLTLARLARCERLAGALLLATDAAAARRLVGTPPKKLRVEVEQVAPEAWREHANRVGAGRLWSKHCWRGAIAGLSCFDEAFCPSLAAPVMAQRGIDAAAVVGADWALVDPALIDSAIARHLDRPDVHHLTFCQCPPGLGAAVVSRHVATELAAAASPLGTIGGLLGYIPLAPQADPIAKPACVTVEPMVRDLLARCIPDSPERHAAIAASLAPMGAGLLSSDASAFAAHFGGSFGAPSLGVETLVIEAGAAQALPKPPSCDTALTIVCDTAEWSAAARLIAQARAAGFAGIHVKTALAGRGHAAQLLEAGPDVVSILLDGADQDPVTIETLDWLIASATRINGLPRPWIVPRLTRCDETYERIEGVYNRWIMSAGACIIDPLPKPRPGNRIEPLPLPANVSAQLKRSTLTIKRDGTVADGLGVPLGSVANGGLDSLIELHNRTRGAREPITLAS